MALPIDYLFRSSSAEFLAPDSTVTGDPLISKERGGIALSDPSEGINTYVWVSSYDDIAGDIKLTNETTLVESTIITGVLNVTQISFAFDSNMRPSIAYVLATGEAYHYWYDSVIEDYTTTLLPVGTTTPRLCHDDKRFFFVTNNTTDVILGYLLSNTLYFRLQRERYQTDHAIATVSAGTELFNIGMGVNMRLLVRFKNGAATSFLG